MRIAKKSLFLFLFGGFIFDGVAQSIDIPCGFNHIHQNNLAQSQDYLNATNAYETALLTQLSTPQNRTQANYNIPVVVHIIHLPSEIEGVGSNISTAQIEAGLAHLNDAFRNKNTYSGGPYYTNAGVNSVDTQIEFCLAQTDPDGNATDGIHRIADDLSNLNVLQFATSGFTELYTMQSLSNWDSNDYLNVWMVNSICEYSNSVGCDLVGLSSFPSSHGYLDDGIVVEAAWWGTSEHNSKVQVHEMGHYLGLYHTFEGGCDESNCMTGGDRVCDTPPDNSTSSGGAGVTINSCATDSLISNSPFANNVQDIYENYMDYSANEMKNTFTPMQKARMEATLLNQRASLINSGGCALSALPLEIVSFEAFQKNETDVELNWQTANEVEVAHFLIEKSTNGLDFIPTKKINAHNQAHNTYQAMVAVDLASTVYYRIKMQDLDGSFEYTDTKAIQRAKSDFSFEIYPNPINTTALNFHSFNDKAVDIDLAILNMSGQIMLQQRLYSSQAHTHKIALPQLASGVYYVQVTNNQQTYFKKLIVK